VSPEALAGGPVGKLRDGDVIEMVIDRTTLEGTVNLVGENFVEQSVADGSRILDGRMPRPDLGADEALPDDTRIWAALQDVSGGTWGGAVYDADRILEIINAGKDALKSQVASRKS
jgi:dihydroxyacid dehydratase/phosphogluconate dehydratase